MELLSTEFFSAVLTIIFIDLVLAGDNALLIRLIANSLPINQKKKAVLLGTFSAIFVRILLTIFAVKLLQIDGLLLLGGVLLIYISYKLLLADNSPKFNPGKKDFWGAIGTILVADLLMGIDNIIAVAGASNGEILLVVIGLTISIPIIVWGRGIVIRLLELFPIIIFIGTGILAWTAAKMIVKDNYVSAFFPSQSAINKFEAIVVLTVLIVSVIVKLYLMFKKTKIAQS
ncbi:membrane protein [Lysinibacillus sp. PLM2]|nr:membrane protein [Lysinibacillus sp. PLM2]